MKKIFNVVLVFLVFSVLAGCSSVPKQGTIEDPVRETFGVRWDGSVIGVLPVGTINGESRFITEYKVDEVTQKPVAVKTSISHMPTVAGQAAVAATSAFIGGATIAGGMVGSAAIMGGAARATANAAAGATRYAVDNQRPASSTTWNIHGGNSAALSSSELVNSVDVGVGGCFYGDCR